MQTRTSINGRQLLTPAGLLLSGLTLLELLTDREDHTAERMALARIETARILLRPLVSL